MVNNIFGNNEWTIFNRQKRGSRKAKEKGGGGNGDSTHELKKQDTLKVVMKTTVRLLYTVIQ